MIIESSMYKADPVVSVLIITYNQQKFIRQCIDSILAQVTEYSYEIIIGEDCGTDSTRDICIEYQQKHSDSIRLLFQDSNQGLIKNYRDVLSLCRGKYIAQCAGDDYWCDIFKLQKQVDYLKHNSKFGFVRTGHYILIGKKLSIGNGYFNGEGELFEYTQYGPVGQASTILFKKELLKYINFDEFINREFSLEDYPLHCIMSKHTEFGYIPDITAVYRILKTSISNNKTPEKILRYLDGYNAARLYLVEIFPEITWWNERLGENYKFFQRLRIAYFNFNYKEAKELGTKFNSPNAKELRLIKYAKNPILFYSAALIRKLKHV